MASIMDLDVATPEEVPGVLRRAAEVFSQSENDLQAAWTDENAGRVWREFAKIMERAAKSCEIAIKKYV